MPINLALQKASKRTAPLDPQALARHTAILAQSGAGKSFLIGRLLEELALKTRARTIVFDPNSDFIRLGDVSSDAWEKKTLSGWLYQDDDAFDEFSRKWKAIEIAILSNRNLPGARRIAIDWGSLSLAEMAGILNIDQSRDADLFWFLTLVGQVSAETWDQSESYFDFDHFRNTTDQVVQYVLDGTAPPVISDNPLAKNLRKAFGASLAFRFRSIINEIGEYDVWRSRGDGEIDLSTILTEPEKPARIVVVDLLSLSTEEERTIVATRALTAIWDLVGRALWEAIRDFEEEDLRIPTFVVIDEAHNLVPGQRDSPAKERLARLLIRFAAEGRKFGICLVAATQRPRKVDLSFLSECENLLLMRMTNETDVEFARNTFGSLPVNIRSRAKSLAQGDVIMCGPVSRGWAVNHVSPRRTISSGKGISGRHWTTPPGV